MCNVNGPQRSRHDMQACVLELGITRSEFCTFTSSGDARIRAFGALVDVCDCGLSPDGVASMYDARNHSSSLTTPLSERACGWLRREEHGMEGVRNTVSRATAPKRCEKRHIEICTGQGSVRCHW
jgi:hypothetical protein